MREVRAEKRTTATDTVIRLFVKCSSSRVTSMGTTRERPPVMATMKRASVSTKEETTSGILLDHQISPALRRADFSSSVHVRCPGSTLFKKLRRGSTGPDVDLNTSPR